MGERGVSAVVTGTAIAGGIAFLCLLGGRAVPPVDFTAYERAVLADQTPETTVPAADPVGSASACAEPTAPSVVVWAPGRSLMMS